MKRALLMLPLLFAGNALAQEQGAYLGLKAGMESITTELEDDSLSSTNLGQDGTSFGAYLGYQIPFMHSMAIAVEAEHASHDFSLSHTNGDTVQALELSKSNSISTLLKNRFSKHVDLYLRLGVVQAQTEFTPTEGELVEEKIRAAIGGFGVEFKNDSNMTFRMEYRYTSYDEVDAFVLDEDTTLAPELDSHAFSIGAHYRF